MKDISGKKILIIQQRGWAHSIGHFLATRLKSEGCRLATITMKRSTHEFIINQQEVKYEMIVCDDDIMSDPKAFLGDKPYSLFHICKELDIDSIWPLVMSVRNHVKSYAYKYYYGFRQNVSDEEMVHYVQALYKNIKDIFDKFEPELIIAPNFVALPHIMLNLFAKKKGIPMFAVNDTKIKGQFFFSYHYEDVDGPFIRRIDELNTGKVVSTNHDRAKKYIENFRSHFIQSEALENYIRKEKSKKTLWQKMRHELSPFYHTLRWYVKPNINYMKSIGITTDYRPPRILFRDHYSKKKYQRFADRYPYCSFINLGKFVYFPLQFQPESAIDVMAPFFSNQIETARQVAMALPDDYTLVVKEHPAMVSMRPPSYLEKLDKTPNVKLIDHRVSGEEVLKKASLVISSSGTTVAEAVFLHVPVIQLGNLGTTLKLPTVFHHTDMTTLSSKIKEVLALPRKSDDIERRLQNYVSAAYDVGFDLPYMAIWAKGKGDKEELWRLYSTEIENIFYKKQTI